MLKNNLSKIMGEKRIIIAELARRTGLDARTIINLYHDRAKQVHLETIEKLCTALQCSVGELFEHIED